MTPSTPEDPKQGKPAEDEQVELEAAEAKQAAAEALDVLRFAPQSASEPVAKVLASAIANAEHNKNLDRRELFISQAYVDEGPTLKRFRPRAQGRAFRIRKRTSHITIVVEANTPVAATTPKKKAGAR